ncbi:MAG: carbamoyl-phosphate synthase large subunit, partial [Halobacteriales archaeon SW_9_67_24]
VYVLEANPRSSRTVPFVSKATGVPIAKLAAQVMAGASLAELDATEQIPEQTSVKEVVLPFDRLPGSDPRLGPEMKSTGEVMGTAGGFGKAYWKAQAATGKPIPTEGVAAIDLSAAEFPDPASDAGRDLRDGFADHFDCRAFDDLAAAIRRGEVDLVISRDRAALEVAVEEAVTYFSTEASARAALDGLAAREADPAVAAVDRRPKRDAEWGRAD